MSGPNPDSGQFQVTIASRSGDYEVRLTAKARTGNYPKAKCSLALAHSLKRQPDHAGGILFGIPIVRALRLQRPLHFIQGFILKLTKYGRPVNPVHKASGELEGLPKGADVHDSLGRSQFTQLNVQVAQNDFPSLGGSTPSVACGGCRVIPRPHTTKSGGAA